MTTAQPGTAKTKSLNGSAGLKKMSFGGASNLDITN